MRWPHYLARPGALSCGASLHGTCGPCAQSSQFRAMLSSFPGWCRGLRTPNPGSGGTRADPGVGWRHSLRQLPMVTPGAGAPGWPWWPKQPDAWSRGPKSWRIRRLQALAGHMGAGARNVPHRRCVSPAAQSPAGPAVAWLIVAECRVGVSCFYFPGGVARTHRCHRPEYRVSELSDQDPAGSLNLHLNCFCCRAAPAW
jgi:hypothetical protein